MSSVKSILNVGLQGISIDVECHMSNGLPAIVIVGLGNKAIDEAKERIRSAFSSSNVPLPRKRITINLAPADVPKDSTCFDLAIALAILSGSDQLKHDFSAAEVIIGELGLDGTIRPVRGIIGRLLSAKATGATTCIIPQGNVAQARLVPGLTLLPFASLAQCVEALAGREPLPTPAPRTRSLTSTNPANTTHITQIAGQERAKRAIIITAAGGHNVFLSGPPGTGKSMLAKALPALLPSLTDQEVLEVTHLHSLASHNYDALITNRPFRSPHHSASHVALVGGGNNLRPGEISLSHRGILLLDEMPEFRRDTLEALRQPLEDRTITVARAKEVAVYPADFILIATANPCPCGYWGTSKPCQCSPSRILQYRQRISGPIMDRFDLYATSEEVDHAGLLTTTEDLKQEAQLKETIERARQCQRVRFKSAEKLNSAMSNEDIKTHALLDGPAKDLLNQAAKKLDISARSYMRIIKVARTIADLDASKMISVEHLSEALQYRPINFRLEE